MKEAMYYHSERGLIVCDICPHQCSLTNGKIGMCRGRKAIGDKLYTTNYGKYASMAIDPIEKKPLYRYNPGTSILSIGPNSCNLACSFCQNWTISQQDYPTKSISVNELIELTRKQSPAQIAFTYSEPLMWYEFIIDFAKSAPEIDIVLVTNAYLNPQPFREILPYISAMNIDLKSFNNIFYETQCGAGLNPVLSNISLAYEAGLHIEITNLLIPSLNDSEEEIRSLCQFICSIDPMIPLHISAYHPDYRLSIPRTSGSDITRACRIAAEYLTYVYAGNVMIPEFSISAYE